MEGKVWDLLKQNFLSVSLLGAGLLLVIISAVIMVLPQNENSTLALTPTPKVTFQARLSPTPLSSIMVDVEGAVQKPGVYSLPANSRVEDAIRQAMGFSSDADESKIAALLNLAAKLSDGSKIYIPRIGDSQGVILGVAADNANGNMGALINLNTASQTELDSLPGVGAVTAQKIIDNRPYSSVADLQTKKIVKSNVYSEIKDKVTTE